MSKPVLFNWGDLTASKAAKKLVQAFTRAGANVVASESDGKAFRTSGVSYKALNLSFSDNQKVTILVKNTGDIYRIKLNGSDLPIKNQDDQVKAVAEIVAALDAGRVKFQQKLTRIKAVLPKGLKSTTAKIADVLAVQEAKLDDDIAEVKAELAKLGGTLDSASDGEPKEEDNDAEPKEKGKQDKPDGDDAPADDKPEGKQAEEKDDKKSDDEPKGTTSTGSTDHSGTGMVADDAVLDASRDNWNPAKHGEVEAGREAMYHGSEVRVLKVQGGMVTYVELDNSGEPRGKEEKAKLVSFRSDATPFPAKALDSAALDAVKTKEPWDIGTIVKIKKTGEVAKVAASVGDNSDENAFYQIETVKGKKAIHYRDLEKADDYEVALYKYNPSIDAPELFDFVGIAKTLGKVYALKIAINTVEGDFSQLTPALAKIAKKYEGKYYDSAAGDGRKTIAYREPVMDSADKAINLYERFTASFSSSDPERNPAIKEKDVEWIKKDLLNLAKRYGQNGKNQDKLQAEKILAMFDSAEPVMDGAAEGFVSVSFAYPSSENAKKAGKVKDGAWVVEKHKHETAPGVFVSGHTTTKEAMKAAKEAGLPWLPFFESFVKKNPGQYGGITLDSAEDQDSDSEERVVLDDAGKPMSATQVLELVKKEGIKGKLVKSFSGDQILVEYDIPGRGKVKIKAPKEDHLLDSVEDVPHGTDESALPDQTAILDDAVLDAAITLEPGTVVHVDGLPFEATDNTVVEGLESNLELAMSELGFISSAMDSVSVSANAIEYVKRDLFKGKKLSTASKNFVTKFGDQEKAAFVGNTKGLTPEILADAVIADVAADAVKFATKAPASPKRTLAALNADAEKFNIPADVLASAMVKIAPELKEDLRERFPNLDDASTLSIDGNREEVLDAVGKGWTQEDIDGLKVGFRVKYLGGTWKVSEIKHRGKDRNGVDFVQIEFPTNAAETASVTTIVKVGDKDNFVQPA